MSEYFKGIKQIEYVGKESREQLAFHYYNPKEIIGESLCRIISDFLLLTGTPLPQKEEICLVLKVLKRAWNKYTDPLDKALARADAAFEFMSKLGVKYFVFTTEI